MLPRIRMLPARNVAAADRAMGTVEITECRVSVKALRVFASHGVLPVERAVGNEFEVSVELDYDARRAMRTDDVTHALNYAGVVQIIEREMATPSCLLEHVAGRIVDGLVADFPCILSGSVTVTKLLPPLKAQMDGASFTASFTVG